MNLVFFSSFHLMMSTSQHYSGKLKVTIIRSQEIRWSTEVMPEFWADWCTSSVWMFLSRITDTRRHLTWGGHIRRLSGRWPEYKWLYRCTCMWKTWHVSTYSSVGISPGFSVYFSDQCVPIISCIYSPGGVFHIPPHLSADTGSLLTTMLQVDPMKRATIQQIK